MNTTSSVFLKGRLGPCAMGLVLMLLLVLAGCGGATELQPTPSPTNALTSSTINLGIPAQALSSPVVGSLPDTSMMHVTLLFKLTQSEQDQLNKASSSGQDLAKDANKIGISDSDFQKIKNALGIQGVSMTLSKLHTSVKIDAQAKTMGVLFQTHFVTHRYKGRTFFAPSTPPRLPTFIADRLVSVVGLDDYSQPMQPYYRGQSQAPARASTTLGARANCSPSRGVVTSQIAQAYSYPPFWKAGFGGQNITISLVEIDGFSASDVANYGACVGYRGHITVKNVDGAPTQPGAETMLDVEMIQGLAPSANIVDYQSGSRTEQAIIEMLQQIIDDNTKNTGSGSIVSMSLGAPENFETLNYLNAVDQQLSILRTKEHMTVFVASGDCAAFTDRVYGSYSVSAPASDPNVVAVGGTVLQLDKKANRAAEIAWSDGSDPSRCTNSWGSGGGNSNFYQQPSYQTGSGVSNNASRGFRQLPDVSAVAFDIAIYFKGKWIEVDGTSAATPIWAAGMALVNTALIQRFHEFYYGPLLFYYEANHPGKYHPYFDVARGDNLGFKAGAGWDFATGWGTPNLVDFYNVLATAAGGA